MHDVGYIDSGLTSSMEMIAICHEMIALTRMLFRGIPTDADHLALEVIDEVGAAGHFLATEHTARFFRTDHFLPRLLDRHNFDGWQAKGNRSLEDTANAFVLEVLGSHRPAPIPEGAQEVIASVLARASERSS